MASTPVRLTGDGITVANIIATQHLASDLPPLKADEVAQIVEQVAEDFSESGEGHLALVHHLGEVIDMDEYEAIYHRVIAEIESLRGE